MTTFSSIGSISESLLKRSQIPGYAAIFSDWNNIVGNDIGSISTPYKVVNIGAQKTLILKSKKGRSLELQHETQNILNKIHKFLGKVFFSQIRIIQVDVNEELTNY
jgi:hypothetical protein